METSYYRCPQLDKSSLKELGKKSNSLALLRFSGFIGVYFVLGMISYWSYYYTVWIFLLCQILMGIVGCSFFASLHESAHQTAFRSRFLNKGVAFISGLLHIYPSVFFRYFHFEHHRHTHIPGKDPEISMGSEPAPSLISGWVFYLFWLSGLPLLMYKLVMMFWGVLGMPEPIRARVYPFFKKEARWKLFFEALIILISLIGASFMAINGQPAMISFLIPAFISHFLLAHYLIAEHNGLPHEGSILDRTRTLSTNKFISLIMWNMNYHAEHHAYPAIPFNSLPELSKILMSDNGNVGTSHHSFHRSVIKDLKQKKNQ